MAVTTEKSTQVTNIAAGTTLEPNDLGGKLRIACFNFVQGAVAGDANSTADLVKLPAGKIRVIGALSRVAHSALGTGRTMDIGFAAYVNQAGAAVSAHEDALHSAADVSAAGSFAPVDEMGGDGFLDLESLTGVTIKAKVESGTIPAAATIDGYIVYAVE